MRFLILALLFAALPAAAGEAPTLEPGSCGLGGVARAGLWTPVRILVRVPPSGGTVDGEVRLRFIGDAERTCFAAPLRMGPGTKAIDLPVLLAAAIEPGQGVEIEIAQKRRILVQQEVDLPLLFLPEKARLLLCLGEESRRGLPSRVSSPGDPSGETVIASCRPEELPRSAACLRAADAILWRDPSPDRLDEAQREALRGWLLGGGRLAVLATPGRDPRLDALLGLRLAARETVLFPAGQPPLRDAKAPAHGAIDAPALPELAGTRWETEATATGGPPLFVRLPFGRGQVSALGPDPDPLPSGLRCALLAPLVDLPLLPGHFGLASPAFKASLTSNPWSRSTAKSPIARASAYQLAASELRPLAFGWVLTYLILLFICAGPLPSLLLGKRRSSWIWIAQASVCLGFAALACGISFVLKGDRNFTREVEILDFGPGGALRTHLLGFFSARPAAIAIDAGAETHLCGLGEASLDDRFGFQSGGGTPEPGAAKMRCGTREAGPERFEVRQWRLHRLAAVGLSQEKPWFAASVRLCENGVPVGTVRNLGPRPVRDCVLLAGTRVGWVGSLSPGQTGTLAADGGGLPADLLHAAPGQKLLLRPYESTPQKDFSAPDAVALSCPSLFRALIFAREWVSPQNYDSRWRPLEGADWPALLAQVRQRVLAGPESPASEPLKGDVPPFPPPDPAIPAFATLSTTQALEDWAGGDDPLRLDCSRLLCGGGLLLLAIADGPTGPVRIDRPCTRRGVTLLRQVITPERSPENEP